MNRQRLQTFRLHNPYLFSLLLLVIITLINLYFQPNIFDRETLNSNMRVFLPLVILAAGQSVVVLGGGIDISIGSIVSITNVILATQVGLQGDPQKMALMMVVVLLVGMLAGAVNGFFVAYMRLQPIITTYATSFLYAGLALFILPDPGGGIPEAFSDFYRDTTPLGLPLAFFVIGAILLAWAGLQQTRYGRYLIAVGGKAEAAYQTGVPVNLVRFSTYVIAGLMAALSGIAITMLVGSGNATTGDQLTLSSITSVVIGGTALSGGTGGVTGSIIGALILGLIRNIISFANIDTWWQTFVNAAIIVVALAAPGAINLFRRKHR